MMDLQQLNEQINKDAYRAKDLEQAIAWISQCGEAVPNGIIRISIGFDIGSGMTGYSDAMSVLGDQLKRQMPSFLAETLRSSIAELAEIKARYAPLFVPAGGGA